MYLNTRRLEWQDANKLTEEKKLHREMILRPWNLYVVLPLYIKWLYKQLSCYVSSSSSSILKSSVAQRRPSSTQELERFTLEEWLIFAGERL
jgi:hypothetical protein